MIKRIFIVVLGVTGITFIIAVYLNADATSVTKFLRSFGIVRPKSELIVRAESSRQRKQQIRESSQHLKEQLRAIKERHSDTKNILLNRMETMRQQLKNSNEQMKQKQEQDELLLASKYEFLQDQLKQVKSTNDIALARTVEKFDALLEQVHQLMSRASADSKESERQRRTYMELIENLMHQLEERSQDQKRLLEERLRVIDDKLDNLSESVMKDMKDDIKTQHERLSLSEMNLKNLKAQLKDLKNFSRAQLNIADKKVRQRSKQIVSQNNSNQQAFREKNKQLISDLARVKKSTHLDLLSTPAGSSLNQDFDGLIEALMSKLESDQKKMDENRSLVNDQLHSLHQDVRLSLIRLEEDSKDLKQRMERFVDSFLDDIKEDQKRLAERRKSNMDFFKTNISNRNSLSEIREKGKNVLEAVNRQVTKTKESQTYQAERQQQLLDNMKLQQRQTHERTELLKQMLDSSRQNQK